jgi:hypothetical protein
VCRVVRRLCAVTTWGCRRRRTGRVGQLLVVCRLRALTRVSLSRRDAAAAAPPLGRLPSVRHGCLLRQSRVAVVVLRARPGSARRRVHVLAGRPVCCARLPPCLDVRPGVPHPVRVSSSCRSEATRPLTSLSSHATLFASSRWSAAVGGAASAICCLRAVLHCSVPSRRPHLGPGCSPPSSNFGVCRQRAFRPSSARS